MSDEERRHLRSEPMHDRDSLHVEAWLWTDGDVSIEGQDLRGEEYEYFLTVPASSVPLLVAALGGWAGDDPLALLAAQAGPIVALGEMTWLRQHDVPYEFFSC